MARPVAYLLAACLLSACGQVDLVAVPLDAATSPARDASLPDMDAAEPEDATTPPQDSGPEDAAPPDATMPEPGPCAYGEDLVAEGVSLSAWLAERYGHAICACDGLDSGGTLTVRSGPGAAGSVATNGNGEARGTLDGDLLLAGEMGLRLSPGDALAVAGGLRLAGPLLGDGASLEVAGDAAVDGRIELSLLSVGGRLTLPDMAGLTVETLMAPDVTRADTDVPPPCPCEPQDQPQVAAWIDSLRPTAAAWAPGEVLDERCGRYLAGDISGEALTVQVEEDALWLVPGDLAGPSLTVEVAEGATLDVLLGGNMQFSGDLTLAGGGGQVRLLVAGQGTLQLSGPGRIAGWLDAPGAELVAEGGLEVDGAVFVRRLAGNGDVLLRHLR